LLVDFRYGGHVVRGLNSKMRDSRVALRFPHLYAFP
jgi:hypothetical protein